MDLKREVMIMRVKSNERILRELFPLEGYGSASSLFIAGRNAGVITKDELTEARDYYGKLWCYAGD